MVHTGFSRGCDRCRQRRLACDRAAPVCGNCTSLGFSCSGSRATGGFLFKDESSKVVKNGRQRHKPRCGPTAGAAAETGVKGARPSESRSPPEAEPKILEIFTCADGHAGEPREMFLMLFLEACTLCNRGPTPSQTQYKALVHFFETLDMDSPVVPVLSQVTGQVLSLYRGVKTTPPIQLQSCIEASGAVRTALNDPSKSQTNEILLALVLLDLGERMEYFRSSDKTCVGHCPAATTLISKRAPHSFPDVISQFLLNAARGSASRTSLWCVQQDLDLDTFATADIYGPDTLFTAFDRLIAHAVRLRRRVITHCNDGSEWCTQSLERFRSECLNLETQLREWFASVPIACRPKMQSHANPGLLWWPSDRFESYASCEDAFLYNQARCLQLLLLGLTRRLSLSDVMLGSTVPASTTTHAIIDAEARVLCDAVLLSAPYFFDYHRDAKWQPGANTRAIDQTPLLLGLPIGARLGHWCLSEILQLMLRLLADREFGFSIDKDLVAVGEDIVARLWRI